jgi:hypothetical protein
VLAATILLDCCLLYRFFAARNAAGADSPTNPAPLAWRDSAASERDHSREDPLDGALGTMLGYVIAIAGVAMLVYTATH